MSVVIIVLAILLGVLGIIGTVVPVIPGPILSWFGLLILFIWGEGTDWAGDSMRWYTLTIWGVVSLIVTLLDYLIPAAFTRVTGGSKHSSWASFLGMLIGSFLFWITGVPLLPLVGAVLGAFIGALLVELLLAKKKAGYAFLAASGSCLGFVVGTMMKFIAAVIILIIIIIYAF